MDDVWGNAWSTSTGDTEAKPSVLNGPKWNTFERDADVDTVDVGSSSWNPDLGLDLGGGNSNMWHVEASMADAWSSRREPEIEHTVAEPSDAESEDGKGLEPRTILPTPPQSPPPSPSPPPASPSVGNIPPSSPAQVQVVPGSPDPFGSFESAEATDAEPPEDFSWALKSPEFRADATDEPWGGAWGSKDEVKTDAQNEGSLRDEWELAQETKRRQERAVPPQLLASLVVQWDEYANDVFPSSKSDECGTQSWRKGLDNVEGLTDLVESLVPVASFPPLQYSKSAVSRALNESLRFTRALALTRSSPMAHLYASKGSTDWERSVKAQKAIANDEWGWDLKHEPEEKSDTADTTKEKKGGLLSFWSKKTSSSPTSDAIVPNQQSIQTVANPTSSPMTARPSNDVSTKTSSSVAVSPTSVSTPPIASVTAPVESAASDGATQSSAVSRFFNRFSRKRPTSPTPSEKDNRVSLVLSENDLSLLSDMVPSTSASSVSGNASLLYDAPELTGSSKAPLDSQNPSTKQSTKLPLPLSPPPKPSRTTIGPASAKTTTSDSSFDAQIANAQLMDVLENLNLGHSGPGAGYAPVSSDLMDSPEEPNAPSSILWPSVIPSSLQALAPPPSRKVPVYNHSSTSANTTSILPPPPPPLTPQARPLGSDVRRSSTLTPSAPPPPSPLRTSFTPQRQDNPLPSLPQRDLDDFSEFFSGSQPPASASSNTNNIMDFGDFGDFISPRAPSVSPPKVTRTPHATQHKQTVELVKKAASRTGQWPAPPPPLPQPIAPPPAQGHLVTFSTQQRRQDLLSEDSPSTLSPLGGSTTPTLPHPLLAAPQSHPTSTPISRLTSPPILAAMPQVRETLPLNSAPAKTTTKSGLSAQDLSFFEGL